MGRKALAERRWQLHRSHAVLLREYRFVLFRHAAALQSKQGFGFDHQSSPRERKTMTTNAAAKSAYTMAMGGYICIRLAALLL